MKGTPSKEMTDAFKKAETKRAVKQPTEGIDLSAKVSPTIVNAPLDQLTPHEDSVTNTEIVDKLAESISRGVMLNAIILNGDNIILSGHHRYLAHKKLGRETIEARYFQGSKDEEELLIFEANLMTRKVGHEERMKGVALIERIYARPVGRPKKDSYAETDKKLEPGNLASLAVKHNIFSSERHFYHAMRVQKKCDPAVFSYIDNDSITYGFAADTLAKLEKDAQRGMLNDIAQNRDAGVNRSQLRDDIKKRVGKDRRKKLGAVDGSVTIPIEEQWNMVRVAPDFERDKMEDLRDIPAKEYCIGGGFVFIECPCRHLDKAFELLRHWKLYYRALIAIHPSDIKGNLAGRVNLPFMPVEPMCIVIGDKIERASGFGREVKLPAAVSHNTPREYAVMFMEEKFGDPCDWRILDMTEREPRKGWTSYKLRYC